MINGTWEMEERPRAGIHIKKNGHAQKGADVAHGTNIEEILCT